MSMTHDPRLKLLRFYLTGPSPCPYLPGRIERKVFTPLVGEVAVELNDTLTQLGFRRSQSIAYRPACEGCMACISVRIVANEFRPSKSMRRTLNRNWVLERHPTPPLITNEQYELFTRYLRSRHEGGGMSNMTRDDFAGMVQDTSVDTVMIEYREPAGQGDRLRAFCLTDRLGDGLSMVYSAFDTDEDADSLGVYMVLDHLRLARELDLPYVYLGYWIRNCRKMAYKERFRPLEALGANGWERLEP